MTCHVRTYLIAIACVATAALALSAGLDTILAPLANSRTPGLAVLIRQNNRNTFQHSYGVRDLRSFTPIDETTNFRLASCTKQFTAMAIMLLVHDGKLHYGDPVTHIFPEFPAYGRSITVRHLLNHTSGLPDYEDLMDATWTPARQIQDADVLSLLEHQTKGKFAPGTKWAYSNSGYVLLGLIVAKASGESFGDFLQHRIFTPLHMTRTLAYRKGKNTVGNRAYGYTMRNGKFEEADQSATSATLGDGGVYSNLTDLAKWDEALQNHTLLTEKEMEPALTPAKLNDGGETHWPSQPGDDNLAPGKAVSYGFGWFLDPYQSEPRMWHFGSTSGFRTAVERYPRQKLTIIILSNRTDLDPAALAIQLRAALPAPPI